MGIKLSDLAKVRVPLEVEFGNGVVVNVEYYPNSVTPHFTRSLRVEEDEQTSAVVDFLIRTLSVMLASWDLNGDDGKPLPIEAEVLSEVPTRLLDRIYGRIMEDMRPNEKQSGSLGDG